MNVSPLIVVYIAIGAFGGIFFWRNRNAALKRFVWPSYMIGVALLFLALVMQGTKQQPPWIIVAAVVAITVVNIRSTRFCDACGATVRGTNPFGRPAVCTECKQPLDRSESSTT